MNWSLPGARRASLAWSMALAFVALLGPAVARADLPAELAGERIREIRISGDVGRFSAERLLGIEPDAPLTRRLLREAQIRLLESGRWADAQFDVEPMPGGVRLVASLVPRIVLFRVDVRGNDVLDDDEVLRALRVETGGELSRETLAVLPERLRAAYGSRGYERARGELELLDTDEPSQKVLVVRITEGEPTRIRQIVHEGEPIPATRGAESTLSLAAGDIYDLREVEEALSEAERTLRERGWYEAELDTPRIARSADGADRGVTLIVPTHVGPRYDVAIRGSTPLDQGDVFDAMRADRERLDTPGVIEGMQARIAARFARIGYPRASVRISRRPSRRPGRARLHVDIRSGRRLRVITRAYPGARHFERGFLEGQVEAFLNEAADTGATSPVDTETIRRLFSDPRERPRETPIPLDTGLRLWSPDAYERAAEHLRELYEAAGYLNARVGPAELRDLPDAPSAPGMRRAYVVLPVYEGPRTEIHEVTIAGNAVMGDREILELAELRRGEPFSHLGLDAATRRIREAYQELGYYYAEVEGTPRFSGDRSRAAVTLEVNERFQVTIGEIVFEGLDATGEDLVRSAIELRAGDLLRPSRLRRAQERLLDLGVFGGVTIAPDSPDLAARVKRLVVTVGERRVQYIDFTAGISTGQGARVGLEYGYRNLFGWAIEAKFRAQFGYQFIFLDRVLEDRLTNLPLSDRIERRITASIGIPYIGLPDVRTVLTGIHVRENERNFGLDKNALDLTLTWRPLRSFSMAWSSDLESNNIEVFAGENYEDLLASTTDQRLRSLILVPEGQTTLVATGLTGTLDRRDNPFSPTRGFYLSATVEWARTLDDSAIAIGEETQTFFSHHLRILGTASVYLPLGGSVVFASQLKAGGVVHLQRDSETYPNRQFFLGGVDTLRGYFQDSLVPQELADAIESGETVPTDAVVQGGDIFMVLRGELRFPIVGSVRGGAFVDLGNTWRDPVNLNPIQLRPTAGLGIRLQTPVGPIALDYGFLLLPRLILNEPVGSLHLSVGLF